MVNLYRRICSFYQGFYFLLPVTLAQYRNQRSFVASSKLKYLLSLVEEWSLFEFSVVLYYYINICHQLIK